jgi:death-on-curing protein
LESEPLWLSRRFLDEAHADQLKQHGGLPGVRDENALESALARPKNRWSYESEVDLYDLAAAYGYALATSHPYSDGNKRTAFIAMYTFLGLNDLEINASQVEVVRFMLEVAAGHLDEVAIADWLRGNTVETEL